MIHAVKKAAKDLEAGDVLSERHGGIAWIIQAVTQTGTMVTLTMDPDPDAAAMCMVKPQRSTAKVGAKRQFMVYPKAEWERAFPRQQTVAERLAECETAARKAGQLDR